MAAESHPHQAALDAFVDQVEAGDIPELDQLILFGSVARGTETNDSDIDVLAVVSVDAERHAIAERLRDIAFDVMVEFGIPFSIQTVTVETMADRADHPFFETVASDGELLYG